MKFILIAGCVAVILFFGLWSVVLSEDLLLSLLEDALKNSGITVEVRGLKKGMLYDFESPSIVLKRGTAELLSCENVSGRINPFSLFLLRLTVKFDGSISGGSISGKANVLRGKSMLDIRVTDADTSGLPFLGLAGVDGKGVLSGALTLKNGTGDITFSISEAKLKSGSFGGITVPLDMFSRARGAMKIMAEGIRVVSFSLEGSDIYARIKGDIRGKTVDLAMELMPEKAFSEQNPVMLLLEKYRVSPGYYVIPVKSTLTF